MSPLFYFSLFIVFLAVLRFLIALLNFITRPILPHGTPSQDALISILIPARNEEANIEKLVKGVLAQQYQNFELIIYSDQSTDKTLSIANEIAKADKRVRVIEGTGLPQGWLGKNHACYKLASHAQGNWLLFLDADVTVSPHFVENALAYAQQKKLALLSMFPRQQLNSLGEKLVVPSMNWILLSLLFLRLVKWSKRKSLAAANGQMMMFNAEQYRKNQWHEKVKLSAAEDISISRLVKRQRLKMATLLGTDDISCRMYSSYAEAINGFSKNVAAFFGGSILVTIVFALIGTIGPFIVLFSLPFPLAFLFFFALISARMLIARLSEQSVWLNVILWPVQHVAFLHMVYSALAYRFSKKAMWKGRIISN